MSKNTIKSIFLNWLPKNTNGKWHTSKNTCPNSHTPKNSWQKLHTQTNSKVLNFEPKKIVRVSVAGKSQSAPPLGLDSTVTHFNKAVTQLLNFLASNVERGSLGLPLRLDLCDQRRGLKKKRGESEGAIDYRETNGKGGLDRGVNARKWKHASAKIGR